MLSPATPPVADLGCPTDLPPWDGGAVAGAWLGQRESSPGRALQRDRASPTQSPEPGPSTAPPGGPVQVKSLCGQWARASGRAPQRPLARAPWSGTLPSTGSSRRRSSTTTTAEEEGGPWHLSPRQCTTWSPHRMMGGENGTPRRRAAAGPPRGRSQRRRPERRSPSRRRRNGLSPQAPGPASAQWRPRAGRRSPRRCWRPPAKRSRPRRRHPRARPKAPPQALTSSRHGTSPPRPPTARTTRPVDPSPGKARPRRTTAERPHRGSPQRRRRNWGGRARGAPRKARRPPTGRTIVDARPSPSWTRRWARGPIPGPGTARSARRLSWSKRSPRSADPQDDGARTPGTPPAAGADDRSGEEPAPERCAPGAHDPPAGGAPIGRTAAALATAAAVAAAAATAGGARHAPRATNASGTRRTPRTCRRAGDGLVQAMRKGRAALGRRAFRMSTRSAAPTTPVLLAGLRVVGTALGTAVRRLGRVARARALPAPHGKQGEDGGPGVSVPGASTASTPAPTGGRRTTTAARRGPARDSSRRAPSCCRTTTTTRPRGAQEPAAHWFD